ncbi:MULTISPECIES: rod shape-determining protein MreD [Clostridiaceae]|uniref:Rod shape-determining protein MreD n=1 Tax=Clostridium facile TaxID=2763035 RepID=A0ABR7IT60_9CLOT|nr:MULTISPECIES: rod shape-determining protein MreD [Clostridiaceae]MBC5788268.1 rod shape-determining protein MreD [Clostridium facile]
MKKSTRSVLKWVIYIVILFFLFILQTTPGFLEIMGVRPVFVLPYAVAIAMLEHERSAAAIGIVAGCLWDSATSRLFGTSVIILMVCCVTISLLVMYLVKSNVINNILFCLGTLVIYFLIDFVFGYLIWGYSHMGLLLVRNILPTIGYSLLFSPIFFLIMQKIRRKIYPVAEEDSSW